MSILKSILKKLLLPVIILCFSCATAQPKFEQVSILVSSTDKYSELWNPFFELLFKQWKSLQTENSDLPIYLISNKKAYTNPRIHNIQILQEKSWSDNILASLEQVKTEYVVILLEDFFINHLDEQRMHDLISTARNNKVNYIQLTDIGGTYTNGGKYDSLGGVYRKAKHDDFRTSLDACLWRTESLKFLLKSGENPWEFESTPGNSRSQGMPGEFLHVLENPPLTYLNMAYQGHLVAKNIRKAETELGVTFERGALPLDEEHKFYLWYKKRLPNILYWKMIVPCKNVFIKMFS